VTDERALLVCTYRPIRRKTAR